MLLGARGPHTDANENGRSDAGDLAALIEKIFECGDVFLQPRPNPSPTATRTTAAPTPTLAATVLPTATVANATPTRVLPTTTPTLGVATLTPTGPMATMTPPATGSRTPTGTPNATAGVPTPSPTTSAPARVVCAALAAPLAIPDDDVEGVADTLILSDQTRIDDLNLRLEITHSFVGDLMVTLEHDGQGIARVLLDRPGVPATALGCDGGDVRCVLDDEAVAVAEDACAESSPVLRGALKPLQSLSAFDGQSLNGTWRLTVVDFAQADTGLLDAWCLEVNGGQATPTPSPSVTPTMLGAGDCCSAHGGLGCDQITCQACVCEADFFCCEVEWDESCVLVAEDDCASECGCS
jgi:subtilisin-like proprotein convertase family protein